MVNDPYFQYQPRVSYDACLVQIWWFQLKFVMSYHADKVKFTDRRTDICIAYLIWVSGEARCTAFCSDTLHYVYFAMRWSTARKEASRPRETPKRDSSLSGHWMGHLLSYSLSDGHDGAMLPINPRGLNGPLTSHFIFSSHMYFSLNTPTHYWSPMPN